jgi:DNA polymerase
MVIGEAPGRSEDERGVPFVGHAGRILDRALQRAFKAPQIRDTLAVTNVVKCRPPGNRDPKSDEIDACFSYLSEEVAVVDPIAVLVVGNAALRATLDVSGVTAYRGVWIAMPGREGRTEILVTYHPAYVGYQGLDSEVAATFNRDVQKFANVVLGKEPFYV